MLLLIVLIAILAPIALAAPDNDEISHLPGYGVPPTKQWSGLLDAGNQTKLHYWMAAAEGSDWTEKPLVLWLNGGPGSSSLLGMLQEQGPLIFGREIKDNDNEKLFFENPYSWTKLTNLVAIESPAGVGYSYCASSLRGEPCHNDDFSTARDAYQALQDLLSNKFPELGKNDFFITGESYAGVYCPTLAKAILDGNEDNTKNNIKINLVGMGVGDPCTDNESQEESMDMLWYGNKYGMVPDEEFDLLYNKCGERFYNMLSQGVWEVGENGYILNDKFGKDLVPKKEESRRLGGADSRTPSGNTYKGEISLSDRCKVAKRKFLLQTSRGFSQSWKKGFINDLTLFGPSAVVSSDQKGSLNYRIAQWMMSDEVREALHVTEVPNRSWPGPSIGWTYKKKYAACNGEAKRGDVPSMVDIYKEIAPRVTGTILVYNGDTDPCVTYEGTRDAIEKVGFKEIVGGSYRPWFFNATADSCELLNAKDVLFGPTLSSTAAGPQLAGHVVDYEHGLSFCTVHGSGHMVPQFRPRAALRMIAGVLSNTHLSPLIAVDDEKIAMMSDTEYDEFLDVWTDNAKSLSDYRAVSY